MLVHLGFGPYLNQFYFVWISLVVSGLVIWLHFRNIKFQRSADISFSLAFIILVCGFFGARLTHIIYENPGLYLSNHLLALQVWNGGYVFFGGVLGALVGSFIFLRSKKESFYLWADYFTPLACLGYALGRIACLMIGCCYGKSCDLFWGLDFGDQILRHPTQAYAFLWESCVFIYLLILEGRSKKLVIGLLFANWLVLHGFGRILMEHFREDFRGHFIGGYSLSTWLSALLIFWGFLLIGKLNDSTKD